MPNSKKSKLVEWQKAYDAPWCLLVATLQVTPVTPLLLNIYLSSTKSHIDEELSCPFNKQQMTPKE